MNLFLFQIVVLWHCDVPHPLDRRWPVPNHVSVKVKHIHVSTNTGNVQCTCTTGDDSDATGRI